MTDAELDACGLFISDSQSDEYYSTGETIGEIYTYHLTLLKRNDSSQLNGPDYIVEVGDFTESEFISADSFVEACLVMSELSPMITAKLLSEVVVFSKTNNCLGGVRTYANVDLALLR